MKRLSILLALLLSFWGATRALAETIDVTVDMTTGDWTDLTSGYASKWVTNNTDPQVTIRHKNGTKWMCTWDDASLMFYDASSGTDVSTTYIIETSTGYSISAVSIDFVADFYYASYYNLGPEWIGVSLNNEPTVRNSSATQSANASVSGLDVQSLEMTVSGNAAMCFAVAKKFVVTLTKMDDRATALIHLYETLEAYRVYSASGDKAFTVGTNPGEYGAEAVAAFNAALQAADIDSAPDADQWTTEQIMKKIQDILDAYQAVLNSRVPLDIPDGYYRIKTGLQYYTSKYIVDEETQEETLVKTYHDKYMSVAKTDNTIQGRWLTPSNLETDCHSLWKITKKGDNYDLVNVATQARFDRIMTTSTPITLSPESQYLIAIEPVTTTDGVTLTNLRIAPQADDAYSRAGYWYIHQNGHKQGTGTSGNLVIWTSSYTSEQGAGGSEWIFVPVSDEDAQKAIDSYRPEMEHEALVSAYHKLLDEANQKLEIAREIVSTDLITESSQFSSPYSYSSYPLSYLTDGKTNVAWYATWTSGENPYLQVELNEPVSNNVELTITHATEDDGYYYQVLQWTVKGSNDPDADEQTWAPLATLNTAYNTSHTPVTTTPFDTKGYRFLRFYFTDFRYKANGYTYASVAEFQLSVNSPNPNAQANSMGNLYTDLVQVIADQASISDADLKQADYDALKTAYDAFMTKFVDPAPLRRLLALTKSASEGILVGTQPGYWADDSQAASFKALYDEVAAYDQKGDLYPDKSDAYIKALTKAYNTIMSLANGVRTDKWYRLHFAPEADFEKYGWKKGNFAETDDHESILGKYIAVADYVNHGDYYEIESLTPESATLGDMLFLQADKDIANTDMSLFRFISVGDSAYVMQNKGTGLFVNARSSNVNYVNVSPQASLVRPQAIGYGLCALPFTSLWGERQNVLNCYLSYNSVRNGSSVAPGTEASIYIEEAGDVTADYDGTEFNLTAIKGSLTAYCFPVEVEAEEGMFGLTLEGNTATLFPMTKAEAGRPFLYLPGSDPSAYTAEGVSENHIFTHGYDFVRQPQDGGAMKGTFEALTLSDGDLYASGNRLLVNKSDSRTLSANSAYVTPDSNLDPTTEVQLVIDLQAEDNITDTLQRVAREGAIYTLDGRFVTQKGNLSSLRHMPKGVYIVNGIRVLVK